MWAYPPNLQSRRSASGQKATFAMQTGMSALPQKAHILRAIVYVPYEPCVDGSGLARTFFTLQHNRRRVGSAGTNSDRPYCAFSKVGDHSLTLPRDDPVCERLMANSFPF